MCMSTADSYLNISAVMLTNDLFLKNYDDELLKLRVAKFMTLFISSFRITLEVKSYYFTLKYQCKYQIRYAFFIPPPIFASGIWYILI